MTAKLPGKQQPNIIRPKSIVKVGPRGRIETASIMKHPSPVERIASIHRNTQSALGDIQRKLMRNINKRRV